MRVISSLRVLFAASAVRRVAVWERAADSRIAFLRSRSAVLVLRRFIAAVCVVSVLRRVWRVRARDSRVSSSFLRQEVSLEGLGERVKGRSTSRRVRSSWTKLMILDGVVSSSVGLWKGISFPWRRPREERRLLMYFDAALRSRGSMTVVGGGGGLEGVFVHEGEEEKEEGGEDLFFAGSCP